MRFSLGFLLDQLDGAQDPDQLARRLTTCGFNVEVREPAGDDEVWDVEVTTNRPDAMNHRGLAREMAVATGARLKPLEVELDESDEAASARAAVEIAAPDLCGRYVARLVSGVRVCESPTWLKARLELCGVRPVNCVVDATNYVLLHLGQPLHAFDLERLGGHRIVVRRARAGEKLTTLDGQARTLDPEMLVIADAERAVALAGIMGGAQSEISDGTSEVLLESAHFDPLTIRRTARRVGLHTEASHRFERGADPQIAGVAADLAAALIVSLAGGRVLAGRIDVCPRPWAPRRLSFSVQALGAFAGDPIPVAEVTRILGGLSFEPVVTGDTVACVAPSFRTDVECTADLYEEVIRHFGYDRIPSRLPVHDTLPGERRGSWELVDSARDAAVAAGLTEVVTLSFVAADEDEPVGTHPLCPGQPLLLANPLAQTQSTMRRSLLPGLLAAARLNFNQGERDLALFEQGRVFSVDGETPREHERLAVVLAGSWGGWERREETGFGVLKGAVEAILERLPMPPTRWRRGGSPWLDEAEGALCVSEDGRVIGVAGMLDPAQARRCELRQTVYVAELDLGAAALERQLPRYRPLPRFPAVTADVTVEHRRDLPYAELEAVGRELAGQWVERLELVSRFARSEMERELVRTTLRLTYRHPERSLTQEEVNAEQARLRQALAERLGVSFA